VGAIAGAALSGRASWAGVPAGVYQCGAAAAAFLWGRAMDPLGRRPTLAAGLVVGALGASIACAAVTLESLYGFLLGLLLMGMANSALQLGRFVAAEVHPPEQRARAIGRVVTGGTVGAIFGPLLVGPAAGLAARAGLTDLSGPYGAAALLFAIASVVVWTRLLPEPRELARALALPLDGAALERRVPRALAELARAPLLGAAVLSLVFAQVVMVMVMVITSLHMKHHDHTLSGISFVLSAHVVGMYAFSLVSGRAADRFGRPAAIAAGAGLLILSCLAAPLSPRLVPLALTLFLLGFGWSLCYVGGSALLADQLAPEERARTQGLTDTLVGLASALGSLGSGVVFSAVGYAAMGLAGAVAALVPLAAALLSVSATRRAPRA
jgi:MFS family permease